MMFRLTVTLNKFNSTLLDLCPNIKQQKDIVRAVKIDCVSNEQFNPKCNTYCLFKNKSKEIICFEFETEREVLFEAKKWLVPLSECPNMMYALKALEDKKYIENQIMSKYPELMV